MSKLEARVLFGVLLAVILFLTGFISVAYLFLTWESWVGLFVCGAGVTAITTYTGDFKLCIPVNCIAMLVCTQGTTAAYGPFISGLIMGLGLGVQLLGMFVTFEQSFKFLLFVFDDTFTNNNNN